MLVLIMSSTFSVHATNTLDVQELIQQLEIQAQDLASLEQGQTVAFNITENNKKEIAVGVAIYLAASPTKILEFIREKGMASVDTEVTAQVFIPPQATLDALSGFGFKEGGDEAANFLAAMPGDDFNLSTQELQTLQAINPGQPDSASQAYREVLLQRWQSYRNNGLKGMAVYDRGAGKVSDPGRELLNATVNNKVLARYFPELYKVFLNYPAALPVGAEEQYFLINRQVEDRPTAVLVHRVILTGDTGGNSFPAVLCRTFL